MSIYLLLKNLHIGLALLSGIGFGLRGYMRLILDRPLAHPMVRIGPHVVDTLLLISGLVLWTLSRYPLASGLGIKLALIVVYIGLGIGAFRASRRGTGVMLYWLAMTCFIGIVIAAVHM